ncbi:MAG: carboxypeptidase regulatory-like domain-containing protein [Thermoplasmata archaeon]|nr:MAG: carboxypeptidase regulatory-like domain-containing protein [Thermoplasmata archaeon]
MGNNLILRRIWALTFVWLLVTVLLSNAINHDFFVRTAKAEQSTPDAYGYSWEDSASPNSLLNYEWVDGVSPGTRLFLGDDNCSSIIDIGFNFVYYGMTYTSLYICSNGFIKFSSMGGGPVLSDIPNNDAPNNIISPFGSDLNPGAFSSGSVYYWNDTDSRRFVVTWDGVFSFGTFNPQTFQVILLEKPGGDGEILFQYKELTNPGHTVVGIEDQHGYIGLRYPRSLSNNLSIKFSADPTGNTLSVEGQDMAPTNVDVGEKYILMTLLTLTANSNVIAIDSIKVDLLGTATYGDVEAAELFHDANHNGLLDSADIQLDFKTFDEESVTFLLNMSFLITEENPENLLILYDISPSAGVGKTVGLKITDETYINVAGPDTVAPFSTIQSSISAVVNPTNDVLSVSYVDLAPSTVSQGEAFVVMMQLELTASTNRVDVDAIRIELSSSSSGTDEDIFRVRILDDANDNGLYDALIDIELANSELTGGEQTVSLSGFKGFFRVTADTPEHLLIVYDISNDATLWNAVDVYIEYVFLESSYDNVSSDNFPLKSSLSTIAAFLPASIDSQWVLTTPTIDGFVTPLEWADAMAVDLSKIRGNEVPAFLLVKNHNTDLYICYDAIGDETEHLLDDSAFAFDTGGDNVLTDGEEDIFQVGGFNSEHQAHYVYNSPFWDMEDSPFDSSLTNHTGLEAEWGFGTSDYGAKNHRIYEYKIPLGLLKASPGDTLGFAALSLESPFGSLGGVNDEGRKSFWPRFFHEFPGVSFYGNLILASTYLLEARTLKVQDYTGQSEGIMHITDHTPELEWTYYSAAGSPQIQYEVRVGTDPGLSDLWVPGAQSGTTTKVTYSGQPLLDGSEYWFGVRVHNGTSWSVWNQTLFNLNTILPPEAPIVPDHDSNIPYTSAQTITWTPNLDPEGDNITYFWQVSLIDPTFAPGNIIASGNTTGTVSQMFSTSPSTPYYWRVNATDSWEFSDYGNMPLGFWNLTTSSNFNNPPNLNWTGELNYTIDGLEPESGEATISTFEYRINYVDSDNHAPAPGYPKLWINKNGVPIQNSPYIMNFDSWVAEPGNHSAGAIYKFSTSLSSIGNYTYYFFGVDINGAANSTSEKDGPILTNTPPVLSWTGRPSYENDGLDPEVGTITTIFTYSIKYSDINNNPPAQGYPKVYIKKGGVEIDGTPFNMTLESFEVESGNYTAGAIYTYSTTLDPQGTDYSYYFFAEDSNTDTTITVEKDGPDVGNTPPTLTWTNEPGYRNSGVDPISGDLETSFTFRVRYADVDNQPVAGDYPKLHIQRGGTDIAGSPYIMVFDSWIGYPDNFIQGAIYTFTTTLPAVAMDYTYFFNATDDVFWAVGAATESVDAPDVFTAPSLTWTGEINFESDGVHPQDGTILTDFSFYVKYTDLDDHPPKTIRVVILKGGIEIMNENLTAVNPGDLDYTAGKSYSFSTTFDDPGNDYGYYFFARDSLDYEADGVATQDQSGPNVTAAAATISGRVTDNNNDPIGNANVVLYNLTGAQKGNTTTNSEGEFELRDVDFGSYYITITKGGYDDYTSDTIVINNTEPINLARIKLNKEGEVEFLWLVLIVTAIAIIAVIALFLILTRAWRRKEIPAVEEKSEEEGISKEEEKPEVEETPEEKEIPEKEEKPEEEELIEEEEIMEVEGYSEEALKSMNKKEVMHIAKESGIKVLLPKSQIIASILGSQEGMSEESEGYISEEDLQIMKKLDILKVAKERKIKVTKGKNRLINEILTLQEEA